MSDDHRDIGNAVKDDDGNDNTSDNSKGDPEDDLKPGHRLLIKTAILMPTAKKDEANIVQLECEGYKDKVILKITFFVFFK